jgi:hypothetical protein
MIALGWRGLWVLPFTGVCGLVIAHESVRDRKFVLAWLSDLTLKSHYR